MFLSYQIIKTPIKGVSCVYRLSIRVSLEAVVAVNGTVASGQERYLCGFAAAVAYYFVHLPLGASLLFTILAARRAALGLVFKSFFCVKFLF